MARPERLGDLKMALLAIGAGVGSAALSALTVRDWKQIISAAIGGASGVVILNLIIHFLRQRS